MNSLLEIAADQGAGQHWRLMGCKDVRHARAVLLQQFRRRVGVEAVRGLSQLKLAALGMVLDGNSYGAAGSSQAHKSRQAHQDRQDARRQHGSNGEWRPDGDE